MKIELTILRRRHFSKTLELSTEVITVFVADLESNIRNRHITALQQLHPFYPPSLSPSPPGPATPTALYTQDPPEIKTEAPQTRRGPGGGEERKRC